MRNKNKVYKLTSLLLHMGNEAMGHYTTFRKLSQEENDWFFISDTSSSRGSLEYLMRNKNRSLNIPYMLFYELEAN